MRGVLLCSLIFIGGCQSMGGGYSEAELSASYAGKPVQHFMNRNGNFTPVAARKLSASERQFIFETEPEIVTVTVPHYTPTYRSYNNAALGNAFNGFNAAANTVPAVSRSSVQKCRATINATHTGKGSTPSDWRINTVSLSGTC